MRSLIFWRGEKENQNQRNQGARTLRLGAHLDERFVARKERRTSAKMTTNSKCIGGGGENN